MKISNLSVGKAGLGWAGLIVLSVSIGAGSARADTFQHGGSAATIEQSGGGTSRTEVTQYRDGQKIITRSGNSTDITIQGGIGSLAPNGAHGYHEWGDDWFDSNLFQQRFLPGTFDFPEFSVSGEREAFKQQMLDRMRSRSRP